MDDKIYKILISSDFYASSYNADIQSVIEICDKKYTDSEIKVFESDKQGNLGKLAAERKNGEWMICSE